MYNPKEDPRFVAAVDLIGRTGASEFQIRYSDDESPTVWFAVAKYGLKAECDAALDPGMAVMRLAERLIDGGQCTHCHKPTGLDPDSIDCMPLNELICWYQFDPELEKFRRGCEGDDN